MCACVLCLFSAAERVGELAKQARPLRPVFTLLLHTLANGQHMLLYYCARVYLPLWAYPVCVT